MWYPQLRDKRPRAYRLQLPSAAHSRAQKHSHVMEHTGYIALPSAAHSGAQKRSHVMVPLAARQAPKSIPATLRCPQLRTAASRSTAISWYPSLRDKRPRAYLSHHEPQHSRSGTPSCATSAQERTGILSAALSCALPRPEAQPCHGTPCCETSAQEHTGYIALPSAARSGAQKHSHVMVPLAARQAPKSVPVTS